MSELTAVVCEPLPDSQMPTIVDALVDPDYVAERLASLTPTSDAVAAGAAIDLRRLSHAGRVNALVAVERQVAMLQARQQRLLALMADDPAPAADVIDHTGKQWVREDVACALRLSAGTAAARLADAQRLAGCLPGTLALLERGQISYRHALALSDATAHLDAQQTAQVEARVLPRATEQTVANFRQSVRRAVLRVSPAGEHERHEQAAEQRRVAAWAREDGMTEVWAVLSTPDAATVIAAIDARAARRAADDPRTVDQRRADAFVDIMTADLGAPGLPRQHGARPAVQVTVTLSTLLGLDDQPADLAGAGPIPAELARRIAADPSGTWRRLITDDFGQLLDYGRTTYRPPQDLADHVIARDGTCRFPGCRRQARRCEIDHLVAFGAGGMTAPGNLICLCPRHHHLKHEAGWTVRGDPADELVWTSRSGHEYRTTSARHPVTDPDPPPFCASGGSA